MADHTSRRQVDGHGVPGGHYLAEEAPKAVLDALDSFLDRGK